MGFIQFLSVIWSVGSEEESENWICKVSLWVIFITVEVENERRLEKKKMEPEHCPIPHVHSPFPIQFILFLNYLFKKKII